MTNDIPQTPAPTRSARERKGPLWRGLAWPAATVVALLVGIGIGSVGDDTTDDSSLRATVDELTAERDRLQAELDDLRESVSEASAEAAADDGQSDDKDDAAGDDGSGEAGSRDNPFAVGEPVGNDDWEISIAEPYEAWEEIQAENQFNDPPPEGMEYYIVAVTATYNGDETGLPWIDLEFAFVGDDNRTYSDHCGVIPNDLSEVDELYAGGTAEGNICIAVPEGASGLWTLSTLFGEPVFFTSS